MIVINAIEIDGGFAPETIPMNVIGSLFDGSKFIYFQSEEEKTDYLTNLQVWNKEAHIAEINALHKSEFERRYKALEYEAEWDVVFYSERPELGYKEEADGLLAYWANGWTAIKAYGETVTENNFIEPLDFVNGL